jgi:hypothetical protein
LVKEFPPRFQKYKVLPVLCNALMFGVAGATQILTTVLAIAQVWRHDGATYVELLC